MQTVLFDKENELTGKDNDRLQQHRTSAMKSDMAELLCGAATGVVKFEASGVPKPVTTFDNDSVCDLT
eukprot:52742-Eustigmatos_ZCMA.PRE.1